MEVNSPGQLTEQIMASRSWPSLSSTPWPISRSTRSILLPPHHTDTCPSASPPAPPACCCETRRTSASPPRASSLFVGLCFATPVTAPAEEKTTQGEGNQANRRRWSCTHKTAAKPVGNPQTHVYGKDTQAPGVHPSPSWNFWL